MANLGQAKLLSPAKHKGIGGVCLTVTSGGKETRTPIQADVTHLGSSVAMNVVLVQSLPESGTNAVISFDAQGRTPFGERFTVRLLPI